MKHFKTNYMFKRVILLLLLISAVIVTSCSREKKTLSSSQSLQNGTLVDPVEFKALTDNEINALILDVRTLQEYRDGHISGSVLIPVQELSLRLDEIDSFKDKTVLVYCRSGNRSTVAAKILADNGFNAVYNLAGGIQAWQKSQFAITKDE